MSDNYRIIASPKNLENPSEISKKILKYLQENKIIENERTNCLLGIKETGYKPGENHLKALEYDENIRSLKTCGVEIISENEVFNLISFTPLTETICPKCNLNRFKDITPMEYHTEKVSEAQLEKFYNIFEKFNSWKISEKSELKCPHCLKKSPIENYKFNNMELSNFGIIFWNWPEFKKEFITKLSEISGIKLEILIGHI
jgi:hypothetical protein